MTARPCIACGDLIDTGTRCTTCQPPEASAHSRGYDAAWTRLSRRARKLQPFCTDCGATHDLQADHTPEAWRRKAAGKPIRLQDIAVVCGPCNRARGAARPGTHRTDERPPASHPAPSTRGRDPHPAPERPVDKAQGALLDEDSLRGSELGPRVQVGESATDVVLPLNPENTALKDGHGVTYIDLFEGAVVELDCVRNGCHDRSLS